MFISIYSNNSFSEYKQSEIDISNYSPRTSNIITAKTEPAISRSTISSPLKSPVFLYY